MSAVGGAPQGVDGVDGPTSATEIDLESRTPPRFAAVGNLTRGALGSNSSLIAGLIILGTLLLLGLLAPVIAPHDPVKQDIDNILVSPGSAGHLLGSDQLGRDTLSRLLYAIRNDLLIALGAIILPFVVGTLVGVVAGYRGGWVDSVLIGIVDVIIAFPILVLLIALVFALGPGVKTIIIAVGAIDWVVYARLSRTSARREAAMEYVMAAQVGGIPTWRILIRHIVPNLISQSVVYAMSDAVLVILFITTLGFLGLGIPPPAPDLGTMIAEGQAYIGSEWWLTVIPGAAIVVAALGLSLIADGLAQKLDAR
jgi:peptide/nickel transport system permease protein